MMRVMELSHDALMSGRLITKRSVGLGYIRHAPGEAEG